ncbi:hypothetical protein [Methylomonas rapida]|uniref:Uncharacterized protein n=1 Tax=Methylomonas rapida TaxID=2963939 RepID=A0ABY7GJW1_9GAMM|nr:hypothetical protein [Methylomonas rapida]WAR44688.1 hypothetical protein NM686_020480 [Methylomonas rapida]
MNHRDDLRRVRRLNKIITNRLIKLYKEKNKSESEMIISSDADEFEIRILSAWSLKYIQLRDNNITDFLKIFYFVDKLKSVEIQKFLFQKVQSFKKYVKQSQSQLPYCFYDLTRPNDIYYVFNWWCTHIDLQPGQENKKVTDIRMKREKPLKNDDGSNFSNIVRTSPDFFSPNVILNKEDRYSVYSTNTHSIKINDKELSNATVLSIRFDNDIQAIPEAFKHFEAYLRIDNATWHTEKRKSESNPSLDHIKHKPYSDIMLLEQSDQYAKVIERYDYISAYLLGLMCFDEVKKIKMKNKETKKDEKTIEQEAANTISEHIYKNTKLTFENYKIIDGYKKVSNLINVIHEIIKLKQNRQRYGKKYSNKDEFTKNVLGK